MHNAKLVRSTLPINSKFFGRQSPKSKAEKVEKMKVPYASVVGSLMYVLVYIRPNIGYDVRVIT